MYKIKRKLIFIVALALLISLTPVLPFASTVYANSGLEILAFPKGHEDSGNDLFGDFVTHSWHGKSDTDLGFFVSTSNQKDSLNRTWNDVIKITDTEMMTFTYAKVTRSLKQLRGDDSYPLISYKGYERLFFQGTPNLQDYEYYIYYPTFNEENLKTEITNGRSISSTGFPGTPQKLSPDKITRITQLVSDGYIPIASLEDLNSIRSMEARTFAKGTAWQREAAGGLDRKYVQVADINANSTASWNNYTGFEPLGNTSSTNVNERRFRGIYDGQNFTISNLYINRPDASVQGLFGFADGATIRNIVLKNADVTARGFVGALVGYQLNSSIEAVAAYGKVKGVDSKFGTIGGLVGYSSGSNISDCYISMKVVGPANVNSIGDIVGRQHSSTSVVNNTVVAQSN